MLAAHKPPLLLPPDPLLPNPTRFLPQPIVFKTLKRSYDTAQLLKGIKQAHRRVTRDFRSLVGKAGKGLNRKDIEIARVKEENHRLKAKLDKYASNVR